MILMGNHTTPDGSYQALDSSSPVTGEAARARVSHNRGMLIALLAVLGVDLATIACLIAVLLIRRAWVSRQPGAFKGAIRVTDGEVPGFRRKWKRGFGRWVGGVLVWAKAPSLLWNELVEADRIAAGTRETVPGDKVRRLGSKPVIVTVGAVGGGQIEIATAASRRDLALGMSARVAGTPAGGKHAATAGPGLEPGRTA